MDIGNPADKQLVNCENDTFAKIDIMNLHTFLKSTLVLYFEVSCHFQLVVHSSISYICNKMI